jgi:hypothetical protein
MESVSWNHRARKGAFAIFEEQDGTGKMPRVIKAYSLKTYVLVAGVQAYVSSIIPNSRYLIRPTV